MKEISLHILDIVENSIDAGANLIKIKIEENIEKNYLKVTIEDNGRGMDEETLKKISNPFYTTRKVRNIGLGIPLLKEAAERCEGYLDIESSENIGTKITAFFKYNHIDRAPLGKIEETLTTILNFSQNFDLMYMHDIKDNSFKLDTREIKNLLEDVDINNPKILIWIRDYIKENIDRIKSSNV